MILLVVDFPVIALEILLPNFFLGTEMHHNIACQFIKDGIKDGRIRLPGQMANQLIQ